MLPSFPSLTCEDRSFDGPSLAHDHIGFLEIMVTYHWPYSRPTAVFQGSEIALGQWQKRRLCLPRKLIHGFSLQSYEGPQCHIIYD